MFKKFFVFTLVFAIMLPMALPASAEVCGVDNQNYASAEAAETAGVDVSYEFACTDPQTESGLYEDESDINFAGMLVEVGSTDIPTTLIIRDNSDQTDYTVEINENTVLGQRRDQYTSLSDWIPGDQIRVIGKINENTDTVEASVAVNLSIAVSTNVGVNGWITAIDKDAKTITYQWANQEHNFLYDEDTRFVAGLKNPASVDDLAINDRIRGRLLKRTDGDDVAKIVVVLRRGADLFMKIRTFRPNATLVRLDSTIIPTTIQVKIEQTPGLKAGDVNNLIGTEGALVTVNVTEDTKIVRKYFGQTTLEEFSVGDQLRIVGRVNDDNTVDAKLIKNNSIWKTSTQGVAGVVNEVDVDDSYLMVNWTPIQQKTKAQLKTFLQERKNTVIAQSVQANKAGAGNNLKVKINNLREKLKARIENIKTVVKEKIGKMERNVKYKKVVINRIKQGNLSLKDLITRKPVRNIKVIITDDTQITIGTNINGTISDIKNGDKLRARGVWSATDKEFTAETIVIVNSIPEIEEALDTNLDDINEVVSEIVIEDDGSTEGDDGNIVEDTTSNTEEEVVLDEDSATEDEDSATEDEDSATEDEDSAT